MIELLKYIDTKLFCFINGHHTPFMDSVMSIAGNKFTWIPLYALLLFFVWRKIKISEKRNGTKNKILNPKS